MATYNLTKLETQDCDIERIIKFSLVIIRRGSSDFDEINLIQHVLHEMKKSDPEMKKCGDWFCKLNY